MGDLTAFTAEIKGRLDIVAIVGEVVSLTKKGASFWGLCPFHNEKSPSFHVYPERGYFHCFGCQASGDAIAFIQKAEGLDFWEVLKRLAPRVGLELPSQAGVDVEAAKATNNRRRRLWEVLGAAALFFQGNLTAGIEAGAMKRWGMTKESLEALGVGYAMSYTPGVPSALLAHLAGLGFTQAEALGAGLASRRPSGLFDAFTSRLMVPIKRDGAVVSFIGRDTTGKALVKYQKLASRSDSWPDVDPELTQPGALFLEWLGPPRHQGPVLVAEGTFDGAAAWQAGFAALALNTTQASKEAKRDLLRVGKRRPLILCFDPDSAGVRGALKLAEELHRAGVDCRILSLPKVEGAKGKTDLAEFLRDYGGNALSPLIASAPRLPEYKIASAPPDLAGVELDSYLKDLALDLNACTPADKERLARELGQRFKLRVKTVELYLKAAEATPSDTAPAPSSPAALGRSREGLPEVEVTVDSEALVTFAEGLLPSLGVPVFSYGGRLTTISARPEAAKGPAPLDEARPAPLSISRLATLLDSAALWVKKKEGNRSLTCCPEKVTASLADRGCWASVPYLTGVRATPYLRPNGTINLKAGYDDETGIYLSPAVEGVEVDGDPTEKAQQEALFALLELVQDFPFVGPAQRASWLALVLTLLARPAIDGATPGFLFSANIRGTGKTLLAELAAYAGIGTLSPYKRAYPHDSEEADKSLLAIARGSRAYVIFDECRVLGNDAINLCLTSTTYGGRILRESIDTVLPWRSVLSFTGNNVRLSGDIDRRILTTALLSEEERPEEKGNFAISDVSAYARGRRRELISAGLTLLRASYLTGSAQLKPWQSYLSWGEVVRSTILKYAPLASSWGPRWELADPIGARPAMDEVPEASYHRLLIAGLLDMIPSAGLVTAEILEKAYGSTLYKKVAEAIDYLTSTPAGKTPTIRAAGNLFAKLKNKPIGRQRLIALPRNAAGVPWRVEALGGPTSPATSPISHEEEEAAPF